MISISRSCREVAIIRPNLVSARQMSACTRLSSSCRRRILDTKHVVFRLQTRTLATEVASEPSSSSSSSPAPATPDRKKIRESIKTSIIVNRSPFLTRTPTPFERAYFLYQQRIQRALHNPFPREFYFKQGSLLEARFNAEERKRERGAFGAPFGVVTEESSKEGEARANAESVAESLTREEDEEPAPRVHEADLKNDVKSLDRRGARNLYLLLKRKVDGKEVWGFPTGELEKNEMLHEAAERNLAAECDVHMDTWIVSRNPIGLYRPPAPPSLDPLFTPRVFFYKAHILAGQVRPKGNDITDFAWLTKQEMESRLEPQYWPIVKDMLSDF